MGDFKTILRKSILAGIYISLAGIVYLTVGGIPGACLFAFGLLAVTQTDSYLYTGKAGFTTDYIFLFLVLFGNILGCIGTGLFASVALPQALQDSAVNIIQGRIEAGSLVSFLRGIGCGVIMSTIIISGKKGNWWTLLYGIPVFILSGFYHSVADAFYLSLGMTEISSAVLYSWIPVVVGNFLGCKLLFLYDRV